MRLTRNELAAAIRAARRYPPGFGFRWGYKGELANVHFNTTGETIPEDKERG